MRTIPKNSDSARRARGLRLTGPRRVVLEVLRGSDAYPTAESVDEPQAWKFELSGRSRETRAELEVRVERQEPRDEG